MLPALLVLAVICLAFANGANDNFKGVATLFGSGTLNYRRALTWATITTMCGSVLAVLLARTLLSNFSGKGLVPSDLVGDPRYQAAVALGAGLTVLLATYIGMPISTTHGLVGGLVGAGWAAGAAINLGRLGTTFFLPLLLSPLVAIVTTTIVYSVLHQIRKRCGITETTCFCVGTSEIEVMPGGIGAAALQRVEVLTASVGETVTCRQQYVGQTLGIEVAPVIDKLHYLSAGAVSFARGMNDTPKIAALLLILPAIGAIGSLGLVGLIIAVGGITSARRVADVMSKQITPMNHGQGVTANFVTSCIATLATTNGLPISTTHVSCGTLFGIGIVTKQARYSMIARILLAWVTTLPVAVILSALAFQCLQMIG